MSPVHWLRIQLLLWHWDLTDSSDPRRRRSRPLELERLESRETPASLSSGAAISQEALASAGLARALSRQRVGFEALHGHREVAFLGDSITEAFSTIGAPAWGRFVAPLSAANLGAGGATAPELLWMLRAGLLANVQPHVVVLEIGTNDLFSGSDPRGAAVNVVNILRELRRQLPNTQVVVVGVLPLGESASDPLRRDGMQYNQLLSRYAQMMGALFVDPGRVYPRPGGVVMLGLLSDGVHPTPLGYELYSVAVIPVIFAAIARSQ